MDILKEPDNKTIINNMVAMDLIFWKLAMAFKK